jgi:hypothetical protein
MTELKTGLAALGLDNAIRLRDIHAKWLLGPWSPVAPEDLRILTDMGYIEIVNDEPVITLLGMDEMNVGD